MYSVHSKGVVGGLPAASEWKTRYMTRVAASYRSFGANTDHTNR